jgi:hypothetical protein
MHNLTRRQFLAGVAGSTVYATHRSLRAAKSSPENKAFAVGIAKIDITPDYPIRLSGFGGRRTESEGVTHPIWAKAMSIDYGDAAPLLLITVDNLGVPDYMVSDLAERLQKKVGMDRAHLAVTSTHTHTAPMLTDVAPTLFGEPIPPAHQEHIDEYSRQLADWLEQVALDALERREPSRIEYGIGSVAFGMNRRQGPSGPVDHDLPVLLVRSLDGTIRAVYTSYACHCVTLSNNKISGDWAGFAQLAIERAFPGATSFVSVGCGADINPSSGVTGDKVDIAEEQGQQIANEVVRLASTELDPLPGPITPQLDRIDLMFDQPPSREEWERRAALPRDSFVNSAIAYHAEQQLARLDGGNSLQTHVSYPIQSWVFGNRMAIVFLPGEVVVDYSLRLKQELGAERLWVNGYSNDVPCYIPSERILKEGGYEGGDAMRYFNRPTRFRPGLEQQIMDTVHGQIAGRLQRAE